MSRSPQTFLEQFADEAIRGGADLLMIEYKDGWDEVVSVSGHFLYEIARLRSSTSGAAAFREELYSITGRGKRISVGRSKYELRAQVLDSFGRDAFRVEFQRL